MTFLILLAAACAPETPGPPGYTVGTVPLPTATSQASVTLPTETPIVKLPLTVSTLVKVRAGPGTSFNTLGLLEPGDRAVAIGRTAANDWLMIEFRLVPQGRGWIFRELATVEGDFKTLPVGEQVAVAPVPGQASPLPAPPPLPPPVTPTPLPPGAPTPIPTSLFDITPIPIELAFYADTTSVDYKQPCTYLRWIADPVQAVYLDGRSMLGRENWLVCPAIPSQTYTLEVVTYEGKRLSLSVTIDNSGLPSAP
ncbi:MAG: hypothetical protein HY260_22225 [Chloroflexi bacterium]|nr:hypothetical protein [Chloroflexota bacterium]